jgi:hypothetical protein
MKQGEFINTRLFLKKEFSFTRVIKRLISKRVGDERRVQGVKVSRSQGKCWGITKSDGIPQALTAITSVWSIDSRA